MTGVAREVEPDRCHLVGVDFLGAMKVDLWGRSAKKHKENEQGSRRGNKMACGGKNDRLRGYIGPKLFTAFLRQRALRSSE